MNANFGDISDADLAYEILRKTGQAMYFRELISEVLRQRGRKVYSVAQAMAEVHTQINMDSRFVHQGKGMWGLADWFPQLATVSPEEPVPVTGFTDNREEKFRDIQQDFAAGATEEKTTKE